MKHRVAIVEQRNYDSSPLRNSIVRAIELAQFDLTSVAGKSVLLKPNMLGAYKPELGITTNPGFAIAVAKIFKEAGADVALGDSSNGVYPLDETWKSTGMRTACQTAGIREMHFEASGSMVRDGLRIARAPLEFDYVINLPKFKTHSLTVLTLAVKNLFGCINGMQKSALHRKNPERCDFSNMLVKTADIIKPALTIIDGIVAMEGDGPSGGTLKELGVIVAGKDVHAVDAASAKLIDIDPIEVDTLAAAKRMGVWNPSEEIEMEGDVAIPDERYSMKLPATYTKGMRDWRISRFVMRRIWSNVAAQPVISKEDCKRCSLCVKACPLGIIEMKVPGEVPIIHREKCIQCFCCHETCPHKAIVLKQSLPLRIIKFLYGLKRRDR